MSAVSANLRPLPKSLSFYVGRLSGFRRQNIKILPQGVQTGILPSTTIRITLPENSLVDLESFALYMDYVAAANNSAPANIDSALIQSMQVTVGGVQIASIQNYNQLAQVLHSWCDGTDARGRRAYNQFGNAAVAAPVGTRKIVLNQFLPLMWRPAVIDTGITGTIEITLNLASKFIQASLTANRANFTLNSLYGAIDVISFADDSYSRMLREAVNSGVVLEVPFFNAQSYLNLVSSMNQSTRFVCSSGSMDMLIATVLNSDFDTDVNDATIYSTDLPYYFKKEGDNVSTWQFLLNGTAIPAYEVAKDFTPSTNAMALTSTYDTLGGHTILTQTNVEQHFAAFLKLNASLTPDERMRAGYDASLTNVQLEWRSTGTAVNALVMVFVCMTSLLRFSGGRQLEVLL